jgi:hypothetical protein
MRNINLDRSNLFTLYTSPGMKEFLIFRAVCILNGQDTVSHKQLLDHYRAFNANIVKDDEDTQMKCQTQEPQPPQISSCNAYTLTLNLPQDAADTDLLGGNTNPSFELMMWHYKLGHISFVRM